MQKLEKGVKKEKQRKCRTNVEIFSLIKISNKFQKSWKFYLYERIYFDSNGKILSLLSE